MAQAIAAAMAPEQRSSDPASPDRARHQAQPSGGSGAAASLQKQLMTERAHQQAQPSGGSGAAASLQEQLMAERARTRMIEIKLEAALKEVQEATTRAARAEAKLEMAEHFMARLEQVNIASA
jgi:3-deoxy-D-manno-octulosonate 8-phosphate phosphatase KdsC-like HAD superfamily phosphatase